MASPGAAGGKSVGGRWSAWEWTRRGCSLTQTPSRTPCKPHLASITRPLQRATLPHLPCPTHHASLTSPHSPRPTHQVPHLLPGKDRGKAGQQAPGPPLLQQVFVGPLAKLGARATSSKAASAKAAATASVATTASVAAPASAATTAGVTDSSRGKDRGRAMTAAVAAGAHAAWRVVVLLAWPPATGMGAVCCMRH